MEEEPVSGAEIQWTEQWEIWISAGVFIVACIGYCLMAETKFPTATNLKRKV